MTSKKWLEILAEGQMAFKNSTSLNFHDLYHPEMGDLVFECTSYSEDGFGWLLSAEYNGNFPKYAIYHPIKNKIITWENCKFINVTGHHLYKYPKIAKKIMKEKQDAN